MKTLAVGELVESAQKTAGLVDFDSESFLEPLGVLVDGVNGHANPQLLASAVRDSIVKHLVNRLRVADYIRSRPELEDTRLDVPLIVIGLPRTGTTLASYLLDCDRERWRSLLNWEALDSVPPPTSDTLRSDPRCLAARAQQEAILARLPFEPPHWEWADGPTECTFLHAQDFKSIAWLARVPSRDYADYLLQTDMTSAYKYEKKVLRVLQSKAPGRWALKMPSHLLWLRETVEAFPHARFVWTHRDPIRATASVGVTFAVAQQLSLGAVDIGPIHDYTPRLMAEHTRRGMAVRETLPAESVLDVSCTGLVTDPISEMRRIYDWLGEELTPETAAAMQTWKDGDDSRQHARKSYSITDYGWTEQELAPLFADYLSAYPQARTV